MIKKKIVMKEVEVAEVYCDVCGIQIVNGRYHECGYCGKILCKVDEIVESTGGGYCHKCGTYIGGTSRIWYVNGNQPVCEVCLNKYFKGSTQPLNVGAGYKVIEHVQGHCPVCGEEGEKLRDWVHQTGDMSALRDVVLGSKHIYTCPKCHCLFWEEV